MRKILLFIAFSFLAGTAQAQIKCWNEGGKRVCGDVPPAGAKVTTLKGSSGGEAPSAPAAAAKDGAKDGAKAIEKKGPMSPAEQEQDYRKRQAEAQKAAEKTAAKEKDAATKRENCERARDALRTYESGQRISQVDAKGERVFLEDAQIEAEKVKARQAIKDFCG